MFDRIYPKRSHPKESACDHRYWKYISKGEDDAEKECFCDIDDDYCFGKGACRKEDEQMPKGYIDCHKCRWSHKLYDHTGKATGAVFCAKRNGKLKKRFRKECKWKEDE